MMMFTASSSSVEPEHYVRWFVTRDKKPGSETAEPSIGDVVSNPAPTTATTQADANLSMMTFRPVNGIQQDRWQWLASGIFKLSNEDGAGEEKVFLKKTIRVMQPCHFGEPFNVNGYGPGHIYLWMYGTDPSASSGNPTVQYAYRISYTDV